MSPSKEQTCQKKKGNGFFIVHKDNVNRTTNYLDHELQALYQHIDPNKLRFDKISIPRYTNNRAQRTVGSYAEVLLNRANPQEEESPAFCANSSLLIKPLTPQKRTAITHDIEEKQAKTMLKKELQHWEQSQIQAPTQPQQYQPSLK